MTVDELIAEGRRLQPLTADPLVRTRHTHRGNAWSRSKFASTVACKMTSSRSCATTPSWMVWTPITFYST